MNDELDALPVALDQVIDRLAPGGRCVVISYHSGEDRIVKQRFRAAATGGCTCPPGLPCTCGATALVRELRPLKRRPSAAERAGNPRADSAVLRAVEPPLRQMVQGLDSGDEQILRTEYRFSALPGQGLTLVAWLAPPGTSPIAPCATAMR